jgi:DNA-binding transcriptional ArsR family regulator
MAGKKAKGELDAIRSEVRTLSEAVWALREQVSLNGAAVAVTNSIATPAGTALTAERGTISLTGTLDDPTSELTVAWSFDGDANAALDGDHQQAVQILAGLGHRQRLAIVTTLIATPTTVTDLVARLNLGTTGAAYHHLNVLQAAGLVTQASRGVFSVPPAEAGLVLTVLAAVNAAAGASTAPLAAGSD